MSDSSSLDQFLTYRLHRVARLSDRETGAAYVSSCGLNTSEARCLVAIGAFEPLSINDLALRANQDKGQASRSAKSLVSKGLAVKESRTDDGRAVWLKLTRKGSAMCTKAMRLIDARNAAIFGVLSANERRTLGVLLDRVASFLEAEWKP